MDVPEYLLLLHQQQAAERARAARLRAEILRCRPFALRHRFARVVGRSFVWFGKRLLVYGGRADGFAERALR